MPQMMPLNWLMLMMFFLLNLFFFMSKMYFLYNPSFNNKITNIKKNKIKNLMKFMW
uniref:ATP synthase F0 subunit 8 n=1 Tax=Platygaster robiniae TaxID=2753657 RepID=UPI0021155F05|nr:ATP synthase F0 subunit 8 [Platygaster robiniae]UTI38867.1 ATP synthase F0 subunit 8 [Platygaster robiniae]